MTEAQAAEQGAHFPPPWVFSTRDIVIFALLAILLINAGADRWYDLTERTSTSRAAPSVAAVSLADVYRGAQEHFIEQGQSRERANLNVALLIPEIEASVERLRVSGDYSAVFTTRDGVPSEMLDVTERVMADVLSASPSLQDVVRSTHVQN